MRRLAVPIAFALLLVACQDDSPSPRPPRGGQDRGSPSIDSPAPTPTPTGQQGPPSAPGPDVRVPDDMPTSIDDPEDLALIPEDLPALLVGTGNIRVFVPPDAAITDGAVFARPEDPIDVVALTWRRGRDRLSPETGFVMWQRFRDAPSWWVVYAFTNAPRREVLGIRVTNGDVTGDGTRDLVTFEETGGTGSCGTWRVLAVAEGGAEEVFRRATCDAALHIRDGFLELQQAVYGPDDPHCCPRGHRFTVLEWDGRRFVKTDSRFEELPQVDDEDA